VEIGTVGHIYDSPSARLPYPQGYRHDLALIVGPNLPRFSQPPNCAKLLTKFATPEEALKAGRVFLLKSDCCRSKPGTLDTVSGHVVAPTARDALIMGVQSTWGYTSDLEITNSLIWRSDPDDKDVGGASGSLCSVWVAMRTKLSRALFSRTLRVDILVNLGRGTTKDT
jgi:hypothetical protein